MAFDDVDINTPVARIIWWNYLAAFLVGVVHCAIQAVFVFHHPHDVVMGTRGRGLILHPNGFDIFMAAMTPFIIYIPGLYAYRSRGYISRIYAVFLGVMVLIYNILVPALQAEVVMKQGHTPDLFWYITISSLLYGFFGKSLPKP